MNNGGIAKIILYLIFGSVIAFCLYSCTPSGRGDINTYMGELKKVDDATLYETQKKVEDSCRAMIASYESDRLTYEQYKDSDDKEKQSWAEQAKMRANKTASAYNNYVLTNNHVWSENVPEDIRQKLEYIE